MLRQTRMHHIQLSVMADVKANALMTISAVMLTFSAPFIAREHFKHAVIVLMIFSLATIVLAMFAVMPSTPMRIKKFEPADVHQPNFNLLFFGSFVGMDYAQFEAAMEEMMNDPSKTYEAQVREIYTLGIFLAEKKYRLSAWRTLPLPVAFSSAAPCWFPVSCDSYCCFAAFFREDLLRACAARDFEAPVVATALWAVWCFERAAGRP